MAYSAPISISNPQAIIIMIDQSGSMSEITSWRGENVTKATAVAEVINVTLTELLARCNHYGEYLPYFDILVVGYSGSGVRILLGNNGNFVKPAFLAQAALRSQDVVNVRTLPDNRQVTTHYKQDIWIEPRAEGKTPMFEAFELAYKLLAPWMIARQDTACFPPMVINITDGEITDASHDDLKQSAGKIKSLATLDGDALLLNVHISANSSVSHIFPCADCCPVDDCENASTLFEISSVMPEIFNEEILNISNCLSPHRGFAFNASLSDLMRMLNVSSSTVPLSI